VGGISDFFDASLPRRSIIAPRYIMGGPCGVMLAPREIGMGTSRRRLVP